MSTDAETFAGQRSRLFGLAYRLLGLATAAEDVAQDAYLRWDRADRSSIACPPAWLTKVVTTLCLDRLSSARARRAGYRGPWLPEPVLTDDSALGPMDTAGRRELVSLGLLVLMERLTPAERAVFVLREAFDHGYREIAEILELGEAACRQLHTRARRHLARPGRRQGDRAGWRDLVDRFLRAATGSDLTALEELLTADVTAVADSDGKAPTARRPVRGRARVAAYLRGSFGRVMARFPDTTTSFAQVNGAPTLLVWAAEALVGALVLEVLDGRIAGLYVVANPDKLTFAAAQLARPVGRVT